MDVIPSTPINNLSVCRNVPLDNTYRDTILFDSVSQQISYFAGKAKYTWTELTPVRMQNKLRLPVAADLLYDCNYIMYSNNNFGSKKFYAFITKIDYVNPNMCEVTIELDVMQTWMFNLVWHPCFVEREHIAEDEIGANILDEGIEIGEHIYEDISNTGHMGKNNICIGTTVDVDFNPTTGGFYGNTYSGCSYLYTTNPASANAFLSALTAADKTEAIVSVNMIPGDMIPQGTDPVSYQIVKQKKYTPFDGYIPKNSKLWCYPYNFMHITDYAGKYVDVHYEDFSSANCLFQLYCSAPSGTPSAWLVPKNYRGLSEDWTSKIVLDNFPQCAYNIDTFKEWYGEKGLETSINLISQAIALSGSVVTGNVPGVVGGATGIQSTLAGIASIITEPPTSRGSANSEALFDFNKKDLWFMNCKIKREYAEIIDGFFDMYGYKTHMVKIPNIKGRPSWNYIQTRECNVTGNICFEDVAKIRSICDKGITFWHTTDVGNYTLDNQPVSEG